MALYSRQYTNVQVATGEDILADHLNAEFTEIYTAIGVGGIGEAQLENSAIINSSQIQTGAVDLTNLDSNLNAQIDLIDDAGSPADPIGLSIYAATKAIFLDWTASTSTDVSHYRIYRDTDNNPSGSTLVGTSRWSSYADITPPNITDTYYYWIQAVDYVGNLSALVGPESSTVNPVLWDILHPELAGFVGAKGSNIANSEYSVFTANTPIGQSADLTVAVSTTYVKTGAYSLKATPSAASGWVYLAATSTTYNIPITGNQKWIISFWTRSATTGANVGTVYFRNDSSNLSSTYGISSANTWERKSMVFDFSSDGDEAANIAFLFQGSAVDHYVDGVMLEMVIDSNTTPSNYAYPSFNQQDIDGSIIAPSSIIAGSFSAGAIYADDIYAGEITASHMAASGFTANMITTGTLDASVVTVSNLNAGSITTGTLSASYISGGTFNASLMTVTNLSASSISTGTLDADEVSVVNLDAAEIKAGYITASVIDATTINGITFKGVGTRTADFSSSIGALTLGTPKTFASRTLSGKGETTHAYVNSSAGSGDYFYLLISNATGPSSIYHSSVLFTEGPLIMSSTSGKLAFSGVLPYELGISVSSTYYISVVCLSNNISSGVVTGAAYALPEADINVDK